MEFGWNYSFHASLVFLLSLSLPLPTTDLQEVEEGARRQKSRWEEKRLRGKLLPSSSVHECLKHLLHLPWVVSSHAESISFPLLLALNHPSLRCLFRGSDVEGRVCLLKWQCGKKKSSPHEMIGHVSSKCHSNSVLSAGFMHRNGAISTRASGLNWIVLRWRTVGCPTKSEKILPFKYLCVATWIQPYLDIHLACLPQQSAYHLTVHKAKSGCQVTSCFQKSRKDKEEREATTFCKTLVTAEKYDHGCLCTAGYWSGHTLKEDKKTSLSQQHFCFTLNWIWRVQFHTSYLQYRKVTNMGLHKCVWSSCFLFLNSFCGLFTTWMHTIYLLPLAC